MEQSIERYTVGAPSAVDTIMSHYKSFYAVWSEFCLVLRKEYDCILMERSERLDGDFLRIESRFRFPSGCGTLIFVMWAHNTRPTGRLAARQFGIPGKSGNHFEFNTLCYFDLSVSSFEVIARAAHRAFYEYRGKNIKNLSRLTKKGVSKPMTGHVPKAVVDVNGNFSVAGSNLLNISKEPQYWTNAVSHRKNFYFNPGDNTPGVSVYRRQGGWAARKRKKVNGKFEVVVLPVGEHTIRSLEGLKTINNRLDGMFQVQEQRPVNELTSDDLFQDSRNILPEHLPVGSENTGKQIIDSRPISPAVLETTRLLTQPDSDVQPDVRATQALENFETTFKNVLASQERLTTVFQNLGAMTQNLQELNTGVAERLQHVVEFVTSFVGGFTKKVQRSPQELRAEVKQIMSEFSTTSPIRFFVHDLNHRMYSYVYEVYGKYPGRSNPRTDKRYKQYDPQRKKTIRALDIIEDAGNMEELLKLVQYEFVENKGIYFLQWAHENGYTSESFKVAHP